MVVDRYLTAIVALSWAGSKEFEGRGYIAYGWDQFCVVLVALCFFFWGVRSGWKTPALAAQLSRSPLIPREPGAPA